MLSGTSTARLRVLSTPTVHISGVDVRLSLRHAEILLLLARHPAGLSADELAVLLSEHELSDVTVRAEVSRLRRLVGPLLSESRPYRLTAPLRTDVDMVHALLDAGDVDAALTAYPGPVLAAVRRARASSGSATSSRPTCARPCWPARCPAW